MSSDGSNQQQVTNSSAQERYPHWSPDGENLVFHSDQSGVDEIYVVSRKNGVWTQTRQLTRSQGSRFPRWSPDALTITYSDSALGLSLISRTVKTVVSLCGDPRSIPFTGLV